MKQCLVELARNARGELCVKGKGDSPIPQEGQRTVDYPFDVGDPFRIEAVFDFIAGADRVPDISSANAYMRGGIQGGQIAVQLYEVSEEILIARGCRHESSYD